MANRLKQLMELRRNQLDDQYLSIPKVNFPDFPKTFESAIPKDSDSPESKEGSFNCLSLLCEYRGDNEIPESIVKKIIPFLADPDAFHPCYSFCCELVCSSPSYLDFFIDLGLFKSTEVFNNPKVIESYPVLAEIVDTDYLIDQFLSRNISENILLSLLALVKADKSVFDRVKPVFISTIAVLPEYLKLISLVIVNSLDPEQSTAIDGLLDFIGRYYTISTLSVKANMIEILKVYAGMYPSMLYGSMRPTFFRAMIRTVGAENSATKRFMIESYPVVSEVLQIYVQLVKNPEVAKQMIRDGLFTEIEKLILDGTYQEKYQCSIIYTYLYGYINTDNEIRDYLNSVCVESILVDVLNE